MADGAAPSATPAGARLAELRRSAPLGGVLLDFDGTLAAIVPDPARARPLPGSLTVLRALVTRFRLVAVVSGRPASFLARHLDVRGLVRVGSYGLERVTPTGVVTSPGASAWRPAVAAAVARAHQLAPHGAVIEDKGLSVTLHYRPAPEVAAWARDFAGGEAAKSGLVVHTARASIELRPPIAADKGTTVSSLIDEAGVSAACVVGDDAGDLPAFEAVARLRLGIRVAVRSDEAPSELLAAADLEVDGPPGALALLRYLAG